MKTRKVLLGTLVVFAGAGLIAGIVMPVQASGRQLILGAICATNLSALGNAMAIYNTEPPDGATGVPPEDVVLAWSAGQGAVLHRIYFGTNLGAVANGSLMVYQGTQPGTTLYVGDLACGTTYYWRVDEFAADGTQHPGDIWSFTTRRFSPIG